MAIVYNNRQWRKNTSVHTTILLNLKKHYHRSTYGRTNGLVPDLKVDDNEKEGGQEEDNNSDSVWHRGDRGLF